MNKKVENLSASKNIENFDKEKPIIEFRNVNKKFGDFTAVNNVDLKIYKGELFSLLGGSGCGKTTLLRMLSGFENPSSGRIILDGVDVTDLPPYERPVNMMFQSYALFPHMTVAKNIAYGLERDGLPKQEIQSRVQEMLGLVQLEQFSDRKPHQLSGGQRQRVALARALAKHPKVLLLDEPLGALDKKLREETQFELMNIQQSLGTTFVVVTHDQEEAMTLSSRMAVMNSGQIIQKGTPREVYEFPKNRHIAEFVGSINIFDATVDKRQGDKIFVTSPELNSQLEFVNAQFPAKNGNEVSIAIRPEKLKIKREASNEAGIISVPATVKGIGYLGNQSTFQAELDSGKSVKVMVQNMRHSSDRSINIGDAVYISWHQQTALLLAE
ncbi:ABC transporter ATP-binding protein [Amphritea sp. 1_MG-2023]|uniref:ABC transporter ATP-binding protein n=1 Tax=Amphritea sp. 1_MG-2023 TaxID=3062670 RepID=UPI0026E445A7|nr:ABC transporter ATP-binding protein [Amphritea sp. 1_MG-2023]MDO6563398.1 ABC transporter ATP-binding protein [Amphritea sp. 1_MG-2023]